MTSTLRFFRALPLFFATALPLTIAACGNGDDDDSAPPGGGASLAAACAQYFDATQAIAGSCLYDVPLDSDYRPSAREAFARWCTSTFSLPGTPADVGATLSRCAAAAGAAPCEAMPFDDDLTCPEFRDLRGTRKAGETCEEGLQCESGRCSGVKNGCGSCERTAGEGESCEGDGVACGPGLYCPSAEGGQPKVCKPKGREGEACTRSDDCGPGLLCNGGACTLPTSLPKAGETCTALCAFGSACRRAKCVALPKENEPCLQGDLGADCALGLRCDGASNVCKRRFTGEVDPGGACDDDTYCKGGTCRGGRCIAYAKLGEVCGDSPDQAAPPCEDDYECRGGACVEEPACASIN